MLGIIRAGAVQVNVNPLYTPRELEHQLNDAGVETIVIFSGVSPTLAEIINKTTVKHVITASPGDGTSAKLPGPAVDPCLASTISFADALQQGAGLKFTPVRLSGDDLLFRQYRTVQGIRAAARAASGRGGRRHSAAALSRVRPDGEFHQLLLAWR
jgi:long-chain acyl-CoA synthetase